MTHIPSPLIYGEILFDHFPDGSSIPGGAPFNVAWNLKALGAEPLLVSSVGNDPEGSSILQSMKDWHMDIRGMQVDPLHPTGSVTVSIQKGQPSFAIQPEQAYDFIRQEGLPPLPSKKTILYHGTLGLRSPTSRATFSQLADSGNADIFLDVNLRPPWFNDELLRESLHRARWVKLNHEELEEITGRSSKSIVEQAEMLRDSFRIEMVIVTEGAKGAFISRADGIERGVPPTIAGLVDTVGAGDAFSSVIILGLLRGWPRNSLLRHALTFSSHICTQRGATSSDITDYEIHKNLYLRNNE